MKNLKTLYKLSHYYSIDDKEQSLYIKSEISPDILANIIGSISLKFEDLIADDIDVDTEHHVQFLEKYYGVEDVTDQYRDLYSAFELSKDEWNRIDVIRFIDGKQYRTITQIDLYEARDFCCGSQSEERMTKYLPKDEDFEKFILGFRDYYLK